jgi:hypothetical protein
MELQHPQECAGAAEHYLGFLNRRQLHPLIQFPELFDCNALGKRNPFATDYLVSIRRPRMCWRPKT